MGSSISPFMDVLEDRNLFSTSVPIIHAQAPFGSVIPIPIFVTPDVFSARLTSNGTLLIQGTRQADTITVTITKPSGAIAQGASLSGSHTGTVYVITGQFNQAFELSDIKRIHVEGGAGDDKIQIDTSVKRRATLIGAKGNDTLIGGALGDTLSGGEGNDLLEAAVTVPTFSVVGKTSRKNTTGGKLFIPGQGLSSVVQYVSRGSAIEERKDSADLLEGDAGDDTLESGNGPDTCIGGAGKDHLIALGRAAAPENLIAHGDKPVDYDGLKVSSIEVVNPLAVLDSAPSNATITAISFHGSRG